jgi:hypothetical protein
VASVQQLVASGVLNGGQGNALLVKLAQALEQMALGSTQQAISMMNAFINQVTAFVAARILTPEEGQRLIDAANVILAQLQAA